MTPDKPPLDLQTEVPYTTELETSLDFQQLSEQVIK